MPPHQSYSTTYATNTYRSSTTNNGYNSNSHSHSHILPGAPAPRPTHDDLLLAGFGLAADPAAASAVVVTKQQQQEQVQVQEDPDEFVSSASPETIAEQERLLREIQERNRAAGTAATSGSPTASGALSVYQVPEDRLVPVPQSRNPSGSDAVHPARRQMKQERKGKIAVSATGGAILGGVLFGPAWPLGVALGGAAGAVCSKQLCKAGERRAQRKYEQKSFQQYAVQQSSVVKGDGASFA